MIRAGYIRSSFGALVVQQQQLRSFTPSPSPPTNKGTAAARPLDGFRVLDLSRILAGPFCTMMLADMGADVIKVELPGKGDDTRSWAPPYSATGEESAYFLGVNRNKRSITIDLKHPDGVTLIKDLAKECDVVVENFVPGTADRLGLGYESLSAVNDQLIYASISGFGQSGPKRDYPAYDVMISAIGGLMGITGPKDANEPCKVGVAITDVCSGLVLQGAILAALLARTKSHRGQHVETSLLDTQVAALANVASAYLVGGYVTKPQGTAHASIVPYQHFTCGDDLNIIVGALNDGQFVKLCDVLGLSDVPLDPRFASNPQRVKHRDEVLELLSSRLRSKGAEEWLSALEKAGVPCARINSIDKVFEDPQVIYRKRVLEVEHPTVGLLKMVAPAATFHGTPLTVFNPPPLLGQHTDEILAGLLKLSPADIALLRSKKVV